MGKASKTSARVKVWVAARTPQQAANPASRLFTVGVMGGAIATSVSGIWLATRLIVDPGSVGWVQKLIPGGVSQQWTARTLQTQSEIAAEAAAAGLWVGKPIYFSTYPGLSRNSVGFDQLLLPLYQPLANPAPAGSTPAACQQTETADVQTCRLVELRVYRPQTSALSLSPRAVLELVDRLPVDGPEELTAIAPLVNAEIAEPGSNRRLPLTTLTFLDGNAPLPGIWLQISGQWQRGSNQTLYGQVVYYNPNHDRLQPLLAWTSPAVKFPTWQQVTGGEVTELVVDQTIGLEPQFQVYQFAALNTPGRPVQVKAIDLHPVLSDDRTYANGLLLARHGLWSTALQMLEQSKKNQPNWSSLAQSQTDLVALHARVAEAQAQRNWGNPGQQILVLLMDGQWSEALSLLRTAHARGYSPSTLLADQSDRLWHRVETAVRVNPQPDVLNWGMLLVALRQDRATALDWLHQQAKGTQPTEQILSLLDPLPVATVTTVPLAAAPALQSAPSAALVPVVSTTTHSSPSDQLSSRVIGTAVPQRSIELSDWLRPDTAKPLTLDPERIWYAVQVIGFQEEGQWRHLNQTNLPIEADSSTAAQGLWQQLGLNPDTQLQLITWSASAQPHHWQATAQAVRVVDGTPWLLVKGEPDIQPISASPALAITPSTISWMEPLSTLTLASLSQQAGWSETLVPTLWQVLQQNSQPLPVSVTNPTALLQQFGDWSVQLMELTGDAEPEAVLTLQVDSSPMNATQTLIFSSQGGVLYSDLTQAGRSLKAIANLGDGNPPALIFSTVQGYGILVWSTQRQRFE